MCGISVAIHPAGRPWLLESAERMHAPIRHRGPDGEGFLVADDRIYRADRVSDLPAITPRVAAAFRRLKILDLSPHASQPMLAPDRQIAILMNGEIYNFRDIRRELEAAGRRFRSSGDTEVALAAYERWGTRCFERLDGMWAIVIVDMERQVVVISRDRFGIKPLYWKLEDETLLLASEIKQLIRGDETVAANRPLVAMFLTGQRIPMLEETFFGNVRSVPPATWAEVPLNRAAEPSWQQYWSHASFSNQSETAPLNYDRTVDELESTLRDALRTHRQSDVALGSLLSGGIDSSTLTVMLAESGERIPTYSFGFRDAAPEVCEMRYVDAVLRQHPMQNAETTFDPEWVRANTGHVIRALEEPLLGLPPLAQYRMLEFCREQGRTVIIDGQGADELFGGYYYHQITYLRDLWGRRRYAEFVREARAVSRATGHSVIRLLARQAAGSAFRAITGRNGTSARPRWMRHDYGHRLYRKEFDEAVADRGMDQSLVNKQVHFDLRWGNAKTILAFGDKNGMAHSVEVRVPFFDRKVVELALSIPDTFKVRNGDRKRILRDVGRRRLPAVVTERRDRMGFGVPEERWFGKELWPSIEPVVKDRTFLQSDCFNEPELQRFIDGFRHGQKNDWRAMWRLYTLGRWAEEFRVAL